MSYKNLAKEIIDSIGGSENIVNVSHCMTRVRFVLEDDKKVNAKRIHENPDIIDIVESMGQVQIVVGVKAGEVCEEITNIIGLKEEKVVTEDLNLLDRTLRTFSNIFTPLIPVLSAAGMIKGILAIVVLIADSKFGFDVKTTDTYQILFGLSDAIFYFMPVFLAYTCGKTFKASPFIAMMIAGTLVYPGVIEVIGAEGGANLFGLTIPQVSYTSSVIPILLSVYFMSFIERFFTKHVPDAVKIIMVPTLTVLVTLPATLFLFGPLGMYIGYGMSAVYSALTNFSPTLTGFFIGGIWCTLVIFGAHAAIRPIGLNDIATTGRQTLFAFASTANLSQSGAAFGVFLKTKDKKRKQVAFSTSITAMFGITEPAIYGVNLPLKVPMICAGVFGAISGGLIGWAGVYGASFATQGILTIPVYAEGGFKMMMYFILGLLISFVGSAVSTYIFWKGDEEVIDDKLKVEENFIVGGEDTLLYSPIEGELDEIKNINDKVFSSGSMGEGVYIKPSKGEVVAPASGVVTVLFPTLHAIGILLDNGIEVLIHIGIDTVELKGDHFEAFIKQGDRVERGQLLLRFDLEKIVSLGYDSASTMIVTNSNDYKKVSSQNRGFTSYEDVGIIVVE